jgi:sec-independent protein translocase protein TatC
MDSSVRHEAVSIVEHVGELRKKLLIAVIAVVVGTTITHFFHEQIIAFLLKPAGTQELIFLSPLEPLLFILKIDIVGGVLIAFPVISWSLFSFIAPAIPDHVRKLLVFFFATSLFLLVVGLLYAFLVTIPLTLKFLFSIVIVGIKNQISAQSYISFFLTQAVIISVIFQVPIFVIGGAHLRMFKTTFLSEKRRYIYLIITIALAIITPTTDIFSLAVVLVPCLVIFEISLIGAKIAELLNRRKDAKKIHTTS